MALLPRRGVPNSNQKAKTAKSIDSAPTIYCDRTWLCERTTMTRSNTVSLAPWKECHCCTKLCQSKPPGQGLSAAFSVTRLAISTMLQFYDCWKVNGETIFGHCSSSTKLGVVYYSFAPSTTVGSLNGETISGQDYK
jgi:hypothetical protein